MLPSWLMVAKGRGRFVEINNNNKWELFVIYSREIHSLHDAQQQNSHISSSIIHKTYVHV